LIDILVQNGTQVLWNSRWDTEMGVPSGGPAAAALAAKEAREAAGADAEAAAAAAPPPGERWVCARRGAVLGLKPRFFNSIGDAHAFRLAAYGHVGLPREARAKDEWPPRVITLITRIGNRALENLDDVVPVLRETGLELNWIQEMGHLTFAEQVGARRDRGALSARSTLRYAEPRRLRALSLRAPPSAVFACDADSRRAAPRAVLRPSPPRPLLQVAAMSRTGILIAIHGAGLTNAMRVRRGRACARARFLPSHHRR
jgi:hypothetical protein